MKCLFDFSQLQFETKPCLRRMDQENKLKVEQHGNEMTIVTSTIFKLSNPGDYSEKYHYSRYGNPSRDSLEDSLASLDGAKYAVTFCSKAAAILALTSNLKRDDLILFSDELLCKKIRELHVACQTSSIKLVDLENSIKPNAKIVWIETMTDHFGTVVDVKSISNIIHSKSKAILVVDNTLTPCYQRPLEHGADAVIYSLGEYIGGHCDVNMGAVLTNDEKMAESLKYFQFSGGAVPSPFDCHIVSRSLKTLKLRMDRHSTNASAVARFLLSSQKIEKVFHPSLNGKNENAMKSPGKSGIITLMVKGSKSDEFLGNLKKFQFSDSLGGVDSTWTMLNPNFPEKTQQIIQNVIKLSIGIEDVNEIIADLDQALNNIE